MVWCIYYWNTASECNRGSAGWVPAGHVSDACYKQMQAHKSQTTDSPEFMIVHCSKQLNAKQRKIRGCPNAVLSV